jgi:hypothetical protein
MNDIVEETSTNKVKLATYKLFILAAYAFFHGENSKTLTVIVVVITIINLYTVF